VTALVELVVVDELGIRPLRPAPRRWIELVGEDAHGNRDGDAFGIEIPFAPVLPIETAAETAVFVNQAIVMLSRMSSRVRPSVVPERRGDQLVAAARRDQGNTPPVRRGESAIPYNVCGRRPIWNRKAIPF
jgi:hypothetical protein